MSEEPNFAAGDRLDWQPSYGPTIFKRPTGSAFIITGTIMLAIGAMALIIGIITPAAVRPYSFSDPEPVLWKWPVTWMGAGLLNLGLLVLAIGRIERALFFLPGEATKKAE